MTLARLTVILRLRHSSFVIRHSSFVIPLPPMKPHLASLLTAAAMLLPSFASAQQNSAPPDHYWVYFGTYTDTQVKGIYRSDFDPKGGKLSAPQLAGESASPSFLAVHPNGKLLYAINEISNFEGKKTGGVGAFAIQKDGKLTLLNQAASGGVGPAHLAVDPTGKWLLVGNYGGGSTALLPIGADGKLGEATSVVVHEAIKPQVSHAHWVGFSPDGKYGFVCDAGVDKIHQFKIDAAKGALVPNDPPAVAIGPGKGTGPRHLAFSTDHTHAYVINETNLTMTALKYDAAKGTFTALDTVSTLPAGVENNKYSTAEIVAHPNGKFVFGSNRTYDS
ncbi:MAG TPA: lactonase family protein, partial [Chthoniobacteraceae bacterium]|nr:lactonase family protein [Chthoniobacteraceae bacterium]